MVIWSWASPTLMVPLALATLALGTPEIIRGRVRKYSRTVAPRSRGLSPPAARGYIDFPNSTTGSTVTIGGIMANASALGDGEDVTAEVRVNGVMIDHSPIKLADVTTGLDITVTSATGLQCESGSEMATIKFVEGFASALRDTDSLVVAFRDIPEGVTVTPSMMGTGMALDMADDTADPPVIVCCGDLAPLTLMTEGEMSGLDEDGNVALSTARAGQIIYTFDDELEDPPGR